MIGNYSSAYQLSKSLYDINTVNFELFDSSKDSGLGMSKTSCNSLRKSWVAPTPIGIVVVNAGWGAGMDAVDELKKLGVASRLHHPRTLWPLTDETRSFIDEKKRVYVIDHSSSAQLSGVFMHAGISSQKLHSIMRYDGTPLRPVDLAEEIYRRETENWRKLFQLNNAYGVPDAATLVCWLRCP